MHAAIFKLLLKKNGVNMMIALFNIFVHALPQYVMENPGSVALRYKNFKQ